MKKIGIFGGTFNPVHIGHLAVAQAAHENLKLDTVYFIPCFLPPHRSGKNVLCAEERYHMVRLAIKDHPYFDIDDFEIKKGGKSYSIDTVRYFCEKYPKAKLFFIIGQDRLADLQTWREIDEIVKLVTFVVVNRPGSSKISSKIKVKFVKMPGLEVSGTYVRKRISTGKSIEFLTPEKVGKYIEKEKLYLNE